MFYPGYYGFGYDPAYFVLVLVSMVLGFITQGYINSTYKKWSRVPSDGETGEQVARRMLNANGCERVGIRGVSGHLTDHYDPATTTSTSRAITARAVRSPASPSPVTRRATPPSASRATS